MIDKIPKTWKKVGMILLGCMIYAIGMNTFISPLKLCSGGGVGVAQVITYFIGSFVDLGDFNLYGIMYLLINIPLFVLAWKGIDKNFFVKTAIGVGAISIFATLVPVPAEPIVDTTISILSGSLITGAGIGLVLFAGGSSGGVDILGIWAMKKNPHASVGKIGLLVNCVLYVIFYFQSDLETVILSVVFMAFYTVILDRMHYQNINVRLMIFTKKEGIDKLIVEQTRRGVTKWDGVGAYTKDSTNVLVSCVSKYEVSSCIDAIHKIDPQAFVVADEHVYVSGNFEKRVE